MFRVDNTAYFSRLVKENRLSFSAVYSNCLLMPGDIEDYTAKGRLFFEVTGSGLYFFCDEHRFFRLYFYTARDLAIELNKFDKPVLVEFIYKKGNKTLDIAAMQKKWMLYGAEEYSQNLKMSHGLDEYIPVESVLRFENRTFEAVRAREEHAGQILTLWEDTHHTFNSSLPNKDELLYDIAQGNIYCILEGEKIAAAEKMIIKNKRASLWLLAVDRTARRMGIGQFLERYNLHIAKTRGCAACFLWVTKDNAAAIKMHEKLGFSLEKEIAEELIIK